LTPLLPSGRFLGSLLSAGLLVWLVPAQSLAQSSPGDGPAWTLVLENDYFNLWQSEYDRPDVEYTQGVDLSVSLPAAWGPLVRLLSTREQCGGRRRCVRWLLGLRHEIYTPPLDAPANQAGLRPYAGWLAAQVALERELEQREDRFRLVVGVTGEPSLAGALQRGIHDLLGNPDPEGWGYQLPFEPGVVVEYETARRLVQLIDRWGSGLQLAAVGAARLGTVHTGATLGTRVSAGYAAGRPWGRSLWRSPARFSWYLLAGARFDAVLRNAFLQGTLFQESQRVRIRSLVGQVEIGLAARYGRFRAEWKAVHRGREYVTQHAAHTYSSITLNVLP
jgi:hypothetical protein